MTPDDLSQDDVPPEFTPSTVDDLAAAASLLIANGRRDEAIALVTEAADELADPRALVLLARLRLEERTMDAAESALNLLQLSRIRCPWNLDAIALMRDALSRLRRVGDRCALDRELRWAAAADAATPARPPRS